MNDNILTIPTALEAILSFAEEAESYPESEYDFVCSKLGITRDQALMMAAILELCVGGDATPENIARKIGCSNLRFIELRNDVDALIDKRYVRASTRGFRGLSYRVPDSVIKAFQKNEAPNGDDIRGLGTSAMLRRMCASFKDFFRDNIDADCLIHELDDLMNFNPENNFVAATERTGFSSFPYSDRVIFLYLVVRTVLFKEEQFSWEDFGRIFESDLDEDDIRASLEEGCTALFRKGLVEHVNNDGIVDTSHICLTHKVKTEFLGEVYSESVSERSANLVDFSAIREKTLFFNSEEDAQVKKLTELLQPENFGNVVSRLREKGFRSGFNCLFYGPAGTGKTESVYQIARRTGRNIFLVDVSRLKSKYVGESEKNVKALFDEYRHLVRCSEQCPILLFNEADALFGKRMKGVERSVDKMENAMQNIILQELENLEGIMIATTNLTENFCDGAFERRFIYKINFRKPGVEAKAKIWESMVEGLDEENASVLAEEYDFSGGQIENISRKMTVDYILNGVQPGIDGIREFCRQESLTVKKPRPRVGF